MNGNYGRADTSGAMQVKRDPPIGRECERISKLAEVIHEALSELDVRLGPISQPLAPQPTTAGSPVESQSSTMQGNLAGIARKLEGAHSRLRSMIDHLDI